MPSPSRGNEFDLSSPPRWKNGVWLVASGLLGLVVLVPLTIGHDGPAAAFAVVLAAALGAAAVIGWAILRTRQQRREYEAALTAWSAERAQREERLRIARELHDIASHGLGLITVRAATATRITGPAADAERRSALTDIEDASRAATTELRRMLNALRSPEGAETVPLRPQLGLDDLPTVIENSARAGLTVTTNLAPLDGVDAGTAATICAITREALTNVARHAGPTTAHVDLSLQGDTVVLTVEDDGPTPGWQARGGAGQGLAGVRERAAVLGGTVTATPVNDAAGRGFRVEARLPKGAAA